ncbi:MAG: hypothetical protein H6765_02305 [Candidatus Peribacteria bacterium]|nr:MAG: hypothetical protein H6765_02305 [Candidatus Peribacteria bacterium]
MARETRKLQAESFSTVAQQALKNLAANKQYAGLAKDLGSLGASYLGRLAQAFAEKESGAGVNALSRRERAPHNAFSYTVYHFLFNAGSPFKTAMDRLGYSTGEIMMDINKATTVLYAGLYEKSRTYIAAAKSGKSGVGEFTKNNFAAGFAHFIRESNLQNVARRYNGLNEQGKKYAADFVTIYKQTAQPVATTEKSTQVTKQAAPSKASAPSRRIEQDEDTEIEYEVEFEEVGRSKDGNFAVHRVVFDVGTWLLSPEEIEFMFANYYNCDRSLVMLTNVKGEEVTMSNRIPSRAKNPQRISLYIKQLDVVPDYRKQLQRQENAFLKMYSSGNTTVYGFKPDVWFEHVLA